MKQYQYTICEIKNNICSEAIFATDNYNEAQEYVKAKSAQRTSDQDLYIVFTGLLSQAFPSKL